MARTGLNRSLIIVCQSMQTLAYAGVSLFLPLIRDDLHITYSQAGTLAAATTFTYALMQIPAGYLADRMDAKRLFVVGLTVVNLLSISFAALDSYRLLLVNQAVSGIFRSLVFAPGLLLMTRQFRSDRSATAMGLYVAGGFSSNILLNLLGPSLVGPLGWRLLFVVFSLAGLLVLGLFALVGDSAGPDRDPARPPAARLRDLLGHRVVQLTGVIQFVRLAVATAIMFWLPSLIVEDKGFSLAVAGLLAAVGSGVTAPANFLGGWFSDRLNRPLAVIGVSMAFLAVSLPVIAVVDSLWPLIAVIVVSSFFVQIYFGPLFSVPVQYLGAANAGVLAGFGNFCANIGGFAVSYGLGVVKDTTGSFAPGLWVLSALCLVGLAATWAVSRLPAPGRPRADDLSAEPAVGS